MALTAYYSAGTATLTNDSAAVVGVGTAWTTNNLAPGDQIESDAGERATILTIDSPTTLTLDKPFAGTAQAAAPYKIWRTFDAQYLMEGARNAFNLLGASGVAALAQLAGAADRGVYFTDPATMDLFTLTAAGRALLDDVSVSDMRQTLGIATDLDAIRKRGTVRAASTANVNLAAPGAAIDGVAMAAGQTFLAKDQAAPAQNGVYIWNGAAVAATRSAEFDTYDEHPGALIVVQEGATWADTLWSCKSDLGGVLGTTAIVFGQTASLPDDVVTNAKLANMATATIKGRATAGTGDPEDLTIAQLRTLLLSSAAIRDVLTANRTYYVRSDGNDGNNGLVNTSGGAFLTYAKALAVVAAIDLAGFTVTVQVQDGAWTAAVTLPKIVGGTAVLQGNVATPSNCSISLAAGAVINADEVSGWTVQGFKIATGSLWGVWARNAAALNLGKMEYGACANGHIYSASNSVINCTAAYTISGAGANHWQAYDGAIIICQALTITLSGVMTFSTAFAVAGRTGIMAVNANTFSGGTITAVRYVCNGNAVIDTAGGGATYLPGSSNGTPTTGGQYL